MLDLTIAARDKLRELASLPEHVGKDARLFIDSKVCDGFRLEIAFDEPMAGDACWCEDGLIILVYEKTAALIEGSRVDWDDAEQRFRVDNPRGEQFKGKFFNKEGWAERLDGGVTEPV